jgi:hypothetical protein
VHPKARFEISHQQWDRSRAADQQQQQQLLTTKFFRTADEQAINDVDVFFVFMFKIL